MKKEFTHDDKGEETMHFLNQGGDEDDNDQCKQYTKYNETVSRNEKNSIFENG